jgi:CDP-2,3-bis-(O-geranylgeranyl)-sn-glycerol synthase
MQVPLDEIRALTLLSAANAVPVVVAKLVGHRWATPLDFGWILPDGERLFGSHKTWRGLASGVVACTLIGLLFDLPPIVGAGFGCASLMADALSSAAKRRMHLEPGTEHVGLDQIGEALLPLVLFAPTLSLGLGEVIAVTATFIVLDIATAQLRHRRWLR